MFRAIRSWLPVSHASKFRSKWDEICRYFTMVHANSNKQALQSYKEQLLDVEASLNVMMECLTMERSEGDSTSLPKCSEMLIKLDTSTPNGVFFHLCQHAKHNEPVGVRRVMLAFLARIIRDADMEDQPLLGYHEHIFLPLLDMVQRISAILHPATVSNQVTLTDMGEQHLDRVAFTRLLSALCHRIDANATFVELFMPEPSEASSSFMLVDLLLPYVGYNSIVSDTNGDLFGSVLKAFFHLARIRDDRIQKLLTDDSFLVRTLFAEAVDKTTKYLANNDKTAFVTKVVPFLTFLDSVHFGSENELLKSQSLSVFTHSWLNECVGRFYTSEEDKVAVHASGLFLHVLSTLRATPYLEAIANFLLCTHFDLFLRRMDDVSQEVSTVTLCLLRALTECAPAFITTYIIQPFLKPAGKVGPLAALSFEDISALFSKGTRREQEGAFEDYKADVHYRCLRMNASLPNGPTTPPTSSSGAFFINALLRKVEGMLEVTPEVNIVLSGILSNMLLLGKAAFIYQLLRDSKSDGIPSLQRTLLQLRARIDSQVETNPKFYNNFTVTRKALFGDVLIQAAPVTMSVTDVNLCGACCVLEEFRLELCAVVSMMPLWMRSQ